MNDPADLALATCHEAIDHFERTVGKAVTEFSKNFKRAIGILHSAVLAEKLGQVEGEVVPLHLVKEEGTS